MPEPTVCVRLLVTKLLWWQFRERLGQREHDAAAPPLPMTQGPHTHIDTRLDVLAGQEKIFLVGDLKYSHPASKRKTTFLLGDTVCHKKR